MSHFEFNKIRIAPSPHYEGMTPVERKLLHERLVKAMGTARARAYLDGAAKRYQAIMRNYHGVDTGMSGMGQFQRRQLYRDRYGRLRQRSAGLDYGRLTRSPVQYGDNRLLRQQWSYQRGTSSEDRSSYERLRRAQEAERQAGVFGPARQAGTNLNKWKSYEQARQRYEQRRKQQAQQKAQQQKVQQQRKQQQQKQQKKAAEEAKKQQGFKAPSWGASDRPKVYTPPAGSNLIAQIQARGRGGYRGPTRGVLRSSGPPSSGGGTYYALSGLGDLGCCGGCTGLG